MCEISTCSAATVLQRDRSLERTALRDEQQSIMCSSEPSDPGIQRGRRHNPALFWVQCLWSLSVRYLPESILAVMTALWHSNGLEPQEDQIGCGRFKDMNWGLKYGAEERQDASVLSLASQWSTTLDFT